MKNLFRFGLVGLALVLGIGAVSIASTHAKSVSDLQVNAKEVDNTSIEQGKNSRVSRYSPTITNDYSNSTGHSWNFGNSDPSDGQATDYATYAHSIKVGMSGYQNNGVFVVSTQSNNNVYYGNYIEVATSTTSNKSFLAQYVPFHITFSVPAHYKGVYSIQYSMFAERTNTTAGSADYSAELFYFGTSVQTHADYFYHQNDFTNDTERGFSEYRTAGGTSGGGTASVSTQYITNIALENHSSTETNMNAYLGLFCYVESSGTAAKYKARFTIDGAYYEDEQCTTAVGGVNGTNVYSYASAISAYNSSASSNLVLYENFTFTSPITLNSAGGTVALKGYSIDLGSNYMLIGANTTINTGGGSGVQKITSSSSYATIAVNTASTLNIDITEVVNTSTASGARTILLGNANAQVFIGNGMTIKSNKKGVQIDDGSLYLAGVINPLAETSIHVGSSSAGNKNIYLYGSSCSLSNIKVNNVSKTYIYASYNSTALSKSQSISITAETGSYSIGDIVVRNVNDTNKSYFVSGTVGYTFNKSGTNLVYAYKTFNVTYNLTGCTQTGGAATATVNANLTFTLVASDGYRLPASISISCTASLTAGTHYTYDKDTGAVCLYKQYIDGNITVTANAVQLVTLSFCTPEGTPVHDPIVVTKGAYVDLPYPDVYPDYYSIAYWYTNPELTEGGTAPGISVPANVSRTYYVKYDQSNLDVVDEFIGIQLHFDQDVVEVTNTADTGACRGDSGYYKVAKQAYTNFTNYQRQAFCTTEGTRYADARARLAAWADANGDYLNLSTYQITKKSAKIGNMVSSSFNSIGTIIVSSIILTSSIAFAVMVIRRKKHSIY